MNLNEIIQNEDEIEILLEKFAPLLKTNSTWMLKPMSHSIYTTLREIYPTITQTETFALTSMLIQLHKRRDYYYYF